jgi:hypothetical protein
MKRLALLLPLVACGGPPAPPVPDRPPEAEPVEAEPEPPPPAADPWADWKSFTNVSPGPWISKPHAKRFVETYVNEIGLEAYKTIGAPIPVGTIIVKPSWESEDGKPGRDGPLFVMVKMPEGWEPDSGDWFYAFQWADPPAKWADKIGTNVDWRSPSEKIEYCVDCHDILDRGLGMLPKERMADW